MPSAAGVAHAGSSLFCPFTDTRQIRQFPTIGSLGYQQSVGISTPAVLPASRIVSPGWKETVLPLRVRVGMRIRSGGEVVSSSLGGKIVGCKAFRVASLQSPVISPKNTN